MTPGLENREETCGVRMRYRNHMSNDIITELTISRALELLDQRKASSREIVRELVRVINERDGQINAYLDLDEEYALAQADEADRTRERGGTARLLGVPIAVKDVISVRGQPCGCASKILSGYRSPYDATAIARLRSEGAVFLGRTNMDEFAMGSTTENSAFKTTRNPWNTDRVPGGSSGGSAAAVAAGEAIAALGSDTGGSIRLPSSFCGCVGVKPSYGRVSRYGLVAYASSLDQIGPITKNVRDAALLIGVMSGKDRLDSTSIESPVPDYESALSQDLSGVTLGLPVEYFVAGIDTEVERLVQNAIRQCERLGARTIEVPLPMMKYSVAVYYVIACAEASANLARFDGVRYGFRAGDARNPNEMYLRTRAAGFGPEVKRRIILGTYVLSSGYYDQYYGRAQKVRALICRDFESAFQCCDALVLPVAPTAAYGIGEKTREPLQMYLGDIFTASANLAGVCGLSVPCGLTTSGLPVGLQVLGPSLREEVIFKVGYAYEQSTEWRLRRPKFHG